MAAPGRPRRVDGADCRQAGPNLVLDLESASDRLGDRRILGGPRGRLGRDGRSDARAGLGDFAGGPLSVRRGCRWMMSSGWRSGAASIPQRPPGSSAPRSQNLPAPGRSAAWPSTGPGARTMPRAWPTGRPDSVTTSGSTGRMRSSFAQVPDRSPRPRAPVPVKERRRAAPSLPSARGPRTSRPRPHPLRTRPRCQATGRLSCCTSRDATPSIGYAPTLSTRQQRSTAKDLDG